MFKLNLMGTWGLQVVKMSWGTATVIIPHVFEKIFGFLRKPEDRVAAASTCRQWEAVIFDSCHLSADIALSVIYERDDGCQRNVKPREIERSKRRYRNVIVAPTACYDGRESHVNWDEAKEVVGLLDRRGPIEWAMIDGRFDEQIIATHALMGFGRVLCHLVELEVKLTLASYWDPHWEKTFQSLTGLRSVKITGGHGRVLSSVQKHCRGLERLVLKRFALTKPFEKLFDFPELKELVIDELDVSSTNLEIHYGVSEVTFPKLEHLTFLINVKASFHHLNLVPVRFVTPALQSARVSDLLHSFVRIEAGPQLHHLTLNMAAFAPINYVRPSLFPNDLTSVSTITIEAEHLAPFVGMALVWTQRFCPNVTHLILDQKLDPLILDQITEYVSTELPKIRKVTNNSNKFRPRRFSLKFKVNNALEDDQILTPDHLLYY
ncbi:uncharacterized protein LOC120415047 [Culex pipiens pallens]|uniref:uncharacterized protein LOC120415047 n=1 Tax=Culex pipiens pallens TaxID=42434 RepID=UPI001953497E|nr:uncharacterized protein LOC120415047 [Culex pipiens pallens]